MQPLPSRTRLAIFICASLSAATGVLSPKELAALRAEANSVSAAFGFRKEEDRAAGLEISIPTKLLSDQNGLGTGKAYKSSDGEFQLQTERISLTNPDAFNALFAERSAASPSAVVSYSHLGQSDFTVTGSSDDRYFYERFYASNSGAVGFD